MDIKALTGSYYEKTMAHFNTLAKPLGSLGYLEILASRISEAQKTFPPVYRHPSVVIFAGDHGVAQQEGVSPYPWNVTKAMVQTFAKGKAAISVIAKTQKAHLEIVDCGVEGLSAPECVEGVQFFHSGISKVATKNFVYSDALTVSECEKAIQVGRESLLRQKSKGSTIALAGEMGIGNTTSATAIACQLLALSAEDLVGPGTGLDAEGIKRKALVIQKALARQKSRDPRKVLASLGGFEIAALVGFYLEANRQDLPVLVDGFICSAAALVAVTIDPDVRRVLIASTLSGEPHHGKILDQLNIGKPLLQLGMRLGEGSAAAAALSLVETSISLLHEMASLSDVLEGRV